jgi:2-hydroxychromene-2-carboxylate isomerase
MHPAAVQVAAKRPSLARQLEARTAHAAELGVRDVPAIRVGEHTFHGERAIEQAAARMRAHAAHETHSAEAATASAASGR